MIDRKSFFIKGIGILVLCTNVMIAFCQLPNLAPSFNNPSPIYPDYPFQIDTLFSEEFHFVATRSGAFAPAKGKHDFIGIFPLETDQYSVFVSHEIENKHNPILGDGGGITAFKIIRDDGHWKVIKRSNGVSFHSLDFANVGLTNRNCGGAVTPYGSLLSAEEDFPRSNEDIFADSTGILDTTNWVIPSGIGPFSGDTLARFENFGWMVELNPYNGKVLRKLYSMGRFHHESALCSPNGIDVLLTEDDFPSIFWRFKADIPFDYTSGQLHFYKQGLDGNSGSWIPIGRSMDTLLNAHNIAVNMGATLFLNLEWITRVNGIPNEVFIAETGRDSAPLRFALSKGASLAHHLLPLDTLGGNPEDSTLQDYYGRILSFNTVTKQLKTYLNGGTATIDSTINLANPDALASTTINGRSYLVIQEDIRSGNYGRMPIGSDNTNNVCELYMLEMNSFKPTLDDLHRVFIGPNGAELSGATFTQDGNTMLLNIQHPFSSNDYPYNRSITIALSGFKTYADSLIKLTQTHGSEDEFMLYPNPAYDFIYFDKTLEEIEIFDSNGKLVYYGKDLSFANLDGLSAGLYQVHSGNTNRSFVLIR